MSESSSQRRRRHAKRLREHAEFLRQKLQDREAKRLATDHLKADISAVEDGAAALDLLAEMDIP